jgi:hypothetical protein
MSLSLLLCVSGELASGTGWIVEEDIEPRLPSSASADEELEVKAGVLALATLPLTFSSDDNVIYGDCDADNSERLRGCEITSLESTRCAPGDSDEDPELSTRVEDMFSCDDCAVIASPSAPTADAVGFPDEDSSGSSRVLEGSYDSIRCP